MSFTHLPGFGTELRQPWSQSGHHPTTAPSQHHCIAPVVPSGGGVGDAAVLHVGGLGGATLQGKDIGFYPGLERRPNL
ncbi:MAG: hypothetical protein NW220_10365, partial [Leptolyngbyaceae cyanobacterium bins.349]|nr:hypothetical protein [Leptolyngbyaceae cyanobacterium bins.349]